MKKVFLIIAFLTVSIIAFCQNTSFQRTDSCNKVKVTMINGVVHMIDGSANVIASDANNYTIVIYWQENQKITFDWRTVQSPISGQAFTSRNQLIEILGKYFFFRRRVTGGTGVETDPIWNAQKSGYVQTSRTLTVTGNSPINISGGTQSLAGNRTWTASADTSILGTQYDIVSDTSHLKSTGAETKYGATTFADSTDNSKLSINSLVGTTGTGALKSVAYGSDSLYLRNDGDNSYTGNYYFGGSLNLGGSLFLHKLAVIGKNSTNVNMFNFVNGDYNINRSTLAQARDTSSFNFYFTPRLS